MIKLYLSYFLIGFASTYNILFLWGFSAGPANALPYIELISSLLLFFMATGLIFFYPKTAAIIGLSTQLGIAPNVFYFISSITDIKIDNFITIIALLIIATVVVLYFITIFWNIQSIRNGMNTGTTLLKLVKIFLAILPFSLVLAWYLWLYIK